MYLILKRAVPAGSPFATPLSPVGWEPVALSAAATAKDAAAEAGDATMVAVVEWTPEYFEPQVTRTVTKLTQKQAESKLSAATEPAGVPPEMSSDR